MTLHQRMDLLMLGEITALRKKSDCPAPFERDRKDMAAIQTDKAAVGLHRAEQYLHQHGLARAVPSEQPNDIPRPDPQIHIRQQLSGAETLNETVYLKQMTHNFKSKRNNQ